MNLLRKLHLGVLLGLAVAAYLASALLGIVHRNYELQSQIKEHERQLALMEEEKIELEYKLRYYQTDAFKEREARAKLGLMAPGESVIILPDHGEGSDMAPNQAVNSKPKTNFQQWWNFLFG